MWNEIIIDALLKTYSEYKKASDEFDLLARDKALKSILHQLDNMVKYGAYDE